MSGAKPDPFDHTVIMSGVPEMPAEATLTVVVEPAPAATIAAPCPAAKRSGKGLAIGLWAAALVLLTGGMTWWLLGPKTSNARATAAASEGVPASLQGYLEAAKQGDPKAMRMLGASYTYGLGVRADKAEGAAWYRKAAEAGDRTADAELKAAGGR